MECMSRSTCNTSRILATTAIAARCLYLVSGYTWSSEENEPVGSTGRSINSRVVGIADKWICFRRSQMSQSTISRLYDNWEQDPLARDNRRGTCRSYPAGACRRTLRLENHDDYRSALLNSSLRS